MNDVPQTFHGVIPWTDNPEIEGTAGLPVANPSGNWSPYSSGNENQSIPGVFDNDNCTGESFTRVIEKELNKLIAANALGTATMAFLKTNGYFNAQGKIDLSERALGAMAGTSQYGNDFPHVYNAATTLGLAPASLWDWDMNTERTYPEYYARPTPQVYAVAAEFLTYFSFAYQPITKAQIPDGLKVSPLWIAIPVCQPWTAFVKYDGHSTVMQHAVDLDAYVSNGYAIEDDYNPYLKVLSEDYYIPAIWNVVITPKESIMNTFVETMNYNGAVGVFVPVTSPAELPILNSIFNVNLVANPDGSIPTTKTVKDA